MHDPDHTHPAPPPTTALVESLPETIPFVGPEAQERARGAPFLARLGANENGFGPSPYVLEAIRDAASDMWMYPDPESHDLRTALGKTLGCPPDRIVVDGGIDTLLGLIVRQYVNAGDPVVTSLGAYPTFNYHVAGFGGQLLTVPYRNDHEDLDALAAKARETSARLVYLANPDNPMGTWWRADDVIAFQQTLPKETVLVLDEAYGETAPAGTLPSFSWQPANVIRLRTFSKAYGLAGLRCGYAFGDPRLIRRFEKVRNHFGMTRMAQVAATAALEDGDHLADTVRRISDARTRITAIAGTVGLHSLPSAANFVTIDCGRDGPFAQAVMAELLTNGIFVRKPMAPGLDRCIRVSVGPDDELNRFAAALPGALDKATRTIMS